MNVEQIMKLIDAGFTKEEIMGFSEPVNDPKPNPGNDPKPVNDPKPNPGNDPKPENDPKPADDMSAVLAAIKATNENISKLALMQGVKNIPAPESVDDILTQFIRV